VDKRRRAAPSDRLYTKRVKNERDVSTLLLVDLSASTKNPAQGSAKSVLTVEKEAMVLFCEALSVVGDDFAVAGFSGAGPSRVDFVEAKGFTEPLSAEAKSRIAGMAPLRNTRMGAAIRHATALLAARESKVKILVVLSDGFPNDLDYKGPHAAHDVQKAVSEARGKAVHVHAITVNMQNARALDGLYGAARHTVISNVFQVPEKLPGIYRALTAA